MVVVVDVVAAGGGGGGGACVVLEYYAIGVSEVNMPHSEYRRRWYEECTGGLKSLGDSASYGNNHPLYLLVLRRYYYTTIYCETL